MLLTLDFSLKMRLVYISSSSGLITGCDKPRARRGFTFSVAKVPLLAPTELLSVAIIQVNTSIDY